jgi:inositol 1,4,5-triphosphate receptor type 1
LTITVFAFTNPYIYAVLLLDVVKRSEDLQNIIRSITVNLNNLAKFGFLGLVGLLLAAIVGFNYYKDYYNREDGVYADSFIYAVVSTIEFGYSF